MVNSSSTTVERLGRYQLTENLSHGSAKVLGGDRSAGGVYRAKVFGALDSTKEFVVKSFPAYPDVSIAISLAAQSHSSLDHPGIIKLFEAGISGGVPFVVSEYFPGLDLGELLSQTNFMLGSSVLFLIKIGESIAHAHEKGVVHSGISPRKLIVCENGNPKLTEFGILSAVLPPDPQADKRWHSRIPYLAPEQLEGGASTAMTDVYQLGTIAYRLMSKRMPFKDTSGKALAWELLENSIPHSGLSRFWDSIIQKALAREPDERYSSMAAMVDALKQGYDSRHPSGSLLEFGDAVKRLKVAYGQPVLSDEKGHPGSLGVSFSRAKTSEEEKKRVQKILRQKPAKKPVKDSIKKSLPMGTPPYPSPALSPGASARRLHQVTQGQKSGSKTKPLPAASEFDLDDTDLDLPRKDVKLNSEKALALEKKMVDNSYRSIEPTQEPQSLESRRQGLLGGEDFLDGAKAQITPPPPPEPPPPALPPNPIAPSKSQDAVPLARIELKKAKASDLKAVPKKTLPMPTVSEKIEVSDDTVPEFEDDLDDDLEDYDTDFSEDATQIDSHLPDYPPSKPIEPVRLMSLTPTPPPAAENKTADPLVSDLVEDVLEFQVAETTAIAPERKKRKIPWLKVVLLLAALAFGGFCVLKALEVRELHSNGGELQKNLNKKREKRRAQAVSDKNRNKEEVPANPLAQKGRKNDAGTQKESAILGGIDAGTLAKSQNLDIESDPKGAKVYLDGTLVGNTPFHIPASSDVHRLSLLLEGHKLYTADIEGQGGHSVNLVPISPPDGPAGIKVRCKQKNRYYIFVDGNDVGQLCPSERIGVSLGNHVVETYDPITDSRRTFHVNVEDTRISVRVYID